MTARLLNVSASLNKVYLLNENPGRDAVDNLNFTNMNNPPGSISLSKSILAGLLTGIICAIAGVVYNIVYREITDFARGEIIMPVSLFIGLPVLLVMGGFAYFLLVKHLPAGHSWYIVLSLVFLAALIIVTILDTRQNSNGLFAGMRGLCIGLEIITTLLAIILIPYFARHSRIYE